MHAQTTCLLTARLPRCLAASLPAQPLCNPPTTCAGGFFRPHRDTPRGDPRFVGSLVVCLPVAHSGGGLRVEHSGHSVMYEFGEGAAAGEVQWAAFFSDCLHEVLPVTSGARVTLAWELFAHPGESCRGDDSACCSVCACCCRVGREGERALRVQVSRAEVDVLPCTPVCADRLACSQTMHLLAVPEPCNHPTALPTDRLARWSCTHCCSWACCSAAAEDAFKLPEYSASLPGNMRQLLHTLRAALDSSSFFVNGGRLGFPCQVGAALALASPRADLACLLACAGLSSLPGSAPALWQVESSSRGAAVGSGANSVGWSGYRSTGGVCVRPDASS